MLNDAIAALQIDAQVRFCTSASVHSSNEPLTILMVEKTDIEAPWLHFNASNIINIVTAATIILFEFHGMRVNWMKSCFET